MTAARTAVKASARAEQGGPYRVQVLDRMLSILDLLAQSDSDLGPSELGHSMASIGVALFSPGENSTEELIKQADVAMYQAKDAGRNAARFYDAEMQARLVDRAAMEEDLR